jgi:hypothetical protein
MKNKFKNIIIIIAAIVISLPATKALFQKEFFHVHDFTHVARLAEMRRAIADGHIPVRWSKNFGFGYGMPLFNFYGPLPFYFAYMFVFFGFSHIFAIKALVFYNFILSFLAMYHVTKHFWGKYGALVSATAAVYVPYRAVNTYVRGSFNELTGITFIIVSLLFLYKAIHSNQGKWVVFAGLSLAGIVTSHNLSAIMAYPALLMFAGGLICGQKPSEKKQKYIRVAGAYVLSIGLSAFYALPAFFEKSYTTIDRLTSAYFHYSQHFLYLRQFISSQWGYGGSVYGLEDGISFEIGKVHIFLATITGLFFVGKFKKIKKPTKTAMIVSGFLIIISILMATFKTKFIWDNISLLQFIQFPWRFLSIITIFVSFLSGGVFLFIKKQKNAIFFALCSVVLLVVLNSPFFKPESFLEDSQALYYTDAKKIQTNMSGILPDYIPNGLDYSTVEPIENRFEIRDGENNQKIEPTIDRTHEFMFVVNSDKPIEIHINIFDFPGWKIYINGVETKYRVDSETKSILLDLDPSILQTNQVTVSGVFTETPIRKAADIITILSIVSSIYILLYERHIRPTSR